MSTPTTTDPLAAAAAVFEKAGNPALARDALRSIDARLTIGGLVLQEVSLETYILLEQIESPLVEQDGADEVSATDFAAAAFVLTREGDVSAELLMQGRPVFEAAVRKFARGIPARELRAAGARLIEHVRAAFSTVVAQGAAPAPGSDEKKTAPNSSAPPATASAGR